MGTRIKRKRTGQQYSTGSLLSLIISDDDRLVRVHDREQVLRL